jgi:hypothetical protein
MNKIKQLNIKQGKKTEFDLKRIIERSFNVLVKKLPPNHPFDYKDEQNIHYEIKGRNNNYNKYDTTMIGQNKIEYANKFDNDFYLIFSFYDGNYYYKYNRNNDNNKLIFDKGGRNDRGRPEYKEYCYIPISELIFLHPDESL